MTEGLEDLRNLESPVTSNTSETDSYDKDKFGEDVSQLPTSSTEEGVSEPREKSLKNTGETTYSSHWESFLSKILPSLEEEFQKNPKEFFDEYMKKINENPNDFFNTTAYFFMDYHIIETVLRTALLFYIDAEIMAALNGLAVFSGMSFLVPYTFYASAVVTQVISFSVIRPLFEHIGDSARFYAQQWIQRPTESMP